MSNSTKYRSNLGVLRFLLALWVFLAHTVPWFAIVHHHKVPVIGKVMAQIRKLQSAGELHPAVIGFLVLSGYVISSSFEMREKLPITAIRSWAIRRIFRIYPIYLIGVIFGVIFWSLSRTNKYNILLSSTDHLNIGCLLAKTTLVSALTPIGYPNCALQGNSPLITAAAEMGLYAIYGLLLIWLTKRSFKFIFPIVFAIWLALSIIMGFFATSRPNYVAFWIHGSPLNYLLPWWLGVLVFQKFAHQPVRRIIWLALTALFFGALWQLFRFILDKNEIQKFIVIQTNLIFWSFLFATLIRILEAIKQLPKEISRVENYGYALYALHAPLSLYLLFYNYSYLMIVLINSAVVIAAYFIVEKPLREFGRRLSKN